MLTVEVDWTMGGSIDRGSDGSGFAEDDAEENTSEYDCDRWRCVSEGELDYG